MKSNYILVYLLVTLLIFISCSNDNKITSPCSDHTLFENAILDAIVAEEDEIYDGLIVIDESNDYINWSNSESDNRLLVLTWTKYNSSYPVGDTISTWWGDTWVTVVPEVKDVFATEDITDSEIQIRLKQILGLPVDCSNTHLIELWVKPDDLFRPSPDNEIDDNIASLEFPENAEDWYIDWFNNNIINSYFPLQYPWTRLGYTYDWADNEKEIGVSEFVIKPNSNVIVESNKTTHLYFE